ncbi:MAG: MBOAT family protein [Gammaproteobacteria bacterium]|nr:MBOAT family protein [Gammaproteobacteria bacterium]
MLFNSYEFVFLFLPIVLAVFFQLGRRRSSTLPTLWLVAASLAFYAYWRSAYVGLLLASITGNYLAGLAIARYRKRRGRGLLAGSITANLVLLAYFKYAGFLIGTFNDLLGEQLAIPEIVLPLAISFFTFNQIAFLVDVYKGYVHDYGFFDYALFILFFPHLIAGPIVHHRDIIPQFRRFNFSFSSPLVSIGLMVFSIGLFKKVVLADHIAPYANALFDSAARAEALTCVEAWFGALAYALQLYFDFSGYSDMAVGGALLFGVRFPWNFDAPYQATSIIDFWRRWHISLSQFLREYLYIPLGGNRAGRLRRSANILLTMLLGGLWHGANWTFVLWGGLHGGYVVVNHLWRDWRARQRWLPRQPTRGERTAGWCLTFVAVLIAWVLFRAQDLSTTLAIYRSMLGFGPDSGWTLDARLLLPHLPATLQDSMAFAWIAALCAICWLPSLPRQTQALLADDAGTPPRWRLRLGRPWAVGTGILAWLAVMFLARPTEFLYYQF